MADARVAEVIQARADALVAAISSADEAVRSVDPDGVHDLRVAMRRIRSLLATFRPLFDPVATEHLSLGLRWAGRELGELRDLEVVHERITGLIADERVELVLGQVLARVEHHRLENLRVAQERATALLADGRYTGLLAELDAFPDRDAARALGAATDDTVKALLRHDWRRVRRSARRAARTGTEEHPREAALHEVRKAAKRARYAAETLEPLFGRDARRMAEAAQAVQQSLGDHRDTLLTRTLLRQLGVQAHLDGDNGFTFGRLHAREQASGAAALEAYEQALARVERKRLRLWLR